MFRSAAVASAVLSVVIGSAVAMADEPSSHASAATETKEQWEARMAWWRDARFGLFVHWGIYAVPAGEWKGLEKKEDLWGEWIMQRAKIPVVEYESLAKRFDPVKFNADEWVKLAKDAGMKYIVITAKHCDGFAMFDSKASKYNIVDATPFARDPMKELQKACNAQGIKLGFYYSHCWDWHEPNALGLDNTWDFPDRKNKDCAKYFREKSLPQIRELLTQYHPSVIWFDVPSDISQEQSRQFHDMIRQLQPACIINDRVGNGLGDYGTPEQFIPPNASKDNFEVCMTLNTHWGFDKNDHAWKQPREVIHNLVDIVSKGGNYLLNVGPTAEGVFPPPAVQILQDVGAWIKANDQSIYGTTGSPLPTVSWGRCTAKPGKLYLHVFDWPSNGRLLVPGLRNSPRVAYFLTDGDRHPLETSRASDRDLVVSLPLKALDSIDTVVVLEIDGTPAVDPMRLLIDQTAAKNVFGAMAAEIHGQTIKYCGLSLGSPVYDYIGSWTAVNDSVSWQFRTIAPGDYDVAIVYASQPNSLGNEYAIQVGENRSVLKVDATGTDKTFKTFKVATVKLPAAQTYTLQVTPKSIAPGSCLMNLHNVILVPVKR